MNILDNLDRAELASAVDEALTRHFPGSAVLTRAGDDALDAVLDVIAIHLADVAPSGPPVFRAAHLRVGYLLAESMGATDTQLCRLYARKVARTDEPWPFISDAGIRSRRAELVAWGVAEHSGGYGRTISNRPSRSWQLANLNAGQMMSMFEELPSLDKGGRAAWHALSRDAGDDLALAAFLADAARYAGPIQ